MSQNNQATNGPPGHSHQGRYHGAQNTGRTGRNATGGYDHHSSSNWRGPRRSQEPALSDFAAAQGASYGASPVPTPLSDAGVYMGFNASNESIIPQQAAGSPTRNVSTASGSGTDTGTPQPTPSSTRGPSPASSNKELYYKKPSKTNLLLANRNRDADLAANIAVSMEPIRNDNSTPNVLRIPPGILELNRLLLVDLASSMGLYQINPALAAGYNDMRSINQASDGNIMYFINLNKPYAKDLLDEMSDAMTVLRLKQKSSEEQHHAITIEMLNIYDAEVSSEAYAAQQRDVCEGSILAAFGTGDNKEAAQRVVLESFRNANQASTQGWQQRRAVEEMRTKLSSIEREFINVCNDYSDVMFNIIQSALRKEHIHTHEQLFTFQDGRPVGTAWADVRVPEGEGAAIKTEAGRGGLEHDGNTVVADEESKEKETKAETLHATTTLGEETAGKGKITRPEKQYKRVHKASKSASGDLGGRPPSYAIKRGASAQEAKSKQDTSDTKTSEPVTKLAEPEPSVQHPERVEQHPEPIEPHPKSPIQATASSKGKGKAPIPVLKPIATDTNVPEKLDTPSPTLSGPAMGTSPAESTAESSKSGVATASPATTAIVTPTATATPTTTPTASTTAPAPAPTAQGQVGAAKESRHGASKSKRGANRTKKGKKEKGGGGE